MTTIDPRVRRPSIADHYQDLLAPLDEQYRHSLVCQLAIGYYEGWRPTRQELAATIAADNGSGRSDGQGVAPAKPSTPPRDNSRRTSSGQQHIAKFEVDCGELLPGFGLIARSLDTSGMTQRGRETCRLMFLTYELRPIPNSAANPPPGPMLFTAPIACFPDLLVPWKDTDGQQRHHAVRRNRILERRGPWPIAGTVQRIQFTIDRQTPAGVPLPLTPAGRLIVDIRNGDAAWRPA